MSDDKNRLLLGRLPGEPKKRHAPSGEIEPVYDKTTKKIVPIKSLDESHVKTLMGGDEAEFPVYFDVSSPGFMLEDIDFIKTLSTSLFKSYHSFIYNFLLLYFNNI